MNRDDKLAQLRELEHGLRFPPIFRAEPGEKPVMYGYVRSRVERPAFVAACQDVLTRWCCDEGWHLSTVFTDIGVGSGELERPGFAALLDVLMLPDSYGVVLIGPSHLSDERTVAGLLAQAIRFTGARLCLLAGDVSQTAAPRLPHRGGPHGAGHRADLRVGRWVP
jgi:hypothetical protein